MTKCKSNYIHVYSRAQAIADGVLVDVSDSAREAGFRYAVALTAAAWIRCVEVPAGVSGQDEAGRLWDVLWMLLVAIRQGEGGSEIRYHLHVRNSGRRGVPPLVELKALCGPGDDGESGGSATRSRGRRFSAGPAREKRAAVGWHWRPGCCEPDSAGSC